MTRVMAEGDDALSVASALTGKVGQGPSDAIVSGGNVDRKIFCEIIFFFSSRRRHTRFDCDWSSDVCSSDLAMIRRGLTHEQPRQEPAEDLMAEIFPMLERIGAEIEKMLGGPADRRTGGRVDAPEQPTARPPDRPTATLADRRAELDQLLRAELEHQGIIVGGQAVARVVGAAVGKGIEWQA